VKGFMRELVTDSGLSAASIADVGALLQAVLGFAVYEDRLDANPAIGLARPLAVTSRDRMFSDDALAVILRAAREASAEREADQEREDKLARLGPAMALAIRLLMLTLARRNEVAGARWAEFDLKAKLWTVPGERAKAKHLHVVPLNDDALEVIEAVRQLNPDGSHFFPSSGPSGEHMDHHSIGALSQQSPLRLIDGVTPASGRERHA
jgi:integrase